MHMLKIVILLVQMGCFWAAFRRSWLCKSRPYWLVSTWNKSTSAVPCVLWILLLFLLNSNFRRKLKNSHKAAIAIFHLKITSTRNKRSLLPVCSYSSVLSCHLSSDYFHLFRRPRQEGSEMTVVLNWAHWSCEGFTACLPKRQLNYSEKAITFLKIKNPFDRDVV